MATTHERHLAQQPIAPIARRTWQGPDLNTPITFTSGRDASSSHQPQQARVTQAYDPDEEDELDGDDGGAGYGRMPRSALRWRGVNEPPALLPAAPQRQRRGRATREVAVPPARLRPSSARTYWPVSLLAGMAVMAALAMALSGLGNWWQGVQDGLSYGFPRTSQVDAVVGHNHDSVAHPSHFLALNLHGRILVLELPAGDPSKAVIYPGPTLGGKSAEQQVVTLRFVDVDRDGTPDLVLRYGDTAEVWLNKGGRFQPPFG